MVLRESVVCAPSVSAKQGEAWHTEGGSARWVLSLICYVLLCQLHGHGLQSGRHQLLLLQTSAAVSQPLTQSIFQVAVRVIF